MEQAVKDLADRIVAKYRQLPPGQRIIVGIAGVPGAGKSTLAYPLTELVNEKVGTHAATSHHINREQGLVNPPKHQSGNVAISVSLDGWHSTRAHLDSMPDPAEARRRRGAAFTFDAEDYVQFVKDLRHVPSLPEIPFRTFSHAKKDPEPGSFLITPSHRIIIIEGLYTLLSAEPWKQATDLLDERIWVECSDEVAKQRLVARHVATGVEADTSSAKSRVEGSDMNNGRFIRDHLAVPTATVDSILDQAYAEMVEEKLSHGEQ